MVAYAFFGAIRAKGGSNNNPTVVQFKATYKRLITNNHVTVSAYVNCQNFDDIKQLHVDEKYKFYINTINKMTVPESTELNNVVSESIFEESERLVEHSTDDQFMVKALSTAVITVQKNMIRKIKCESCLNELVNKPLQSHVHKDIQNICKAAETEFKIITNQKDNFNIEKYYEVLMNRVLFTLCNEAPNIFVGLQQHDKPVGVNHRNFVIKLCIDMYFKKRLEQYAKDFTDHKRSL